MNDSETIRITLRSRSTRMNSTVYFSHGFKKKYSFYDGQCKDTRFIITRPTFIRIIHCTCLSDGRSTGRDTETLAERHDCDDVRKKTENKKKKKKTPRLIWIYTFSRMGEKNRPKTNHDYYNTQG